MFVVMTGRDWVRSGIAPEGQGPGRGIVDLSKSDLGEEVQGLFLIIGDEARLVPEFE